ncbi:MAG: hypothetical protein M2R45_04077 [Verrucomicrobia subdivision 3 bacterium]|nr:hypothetical protein [Limisphaerales bacterium]MCS1417016.1 hypothetical protein [Limisphaerales bacterium]
MAEFPELKAVFEVFGGYEDFMMIGLSLDDDSQTPKRFCEKNGMKWLQAFTGRWGGFHRLND